MDAKKNVLVRAAVLLVLFINQILIFLGLNPIPFSEEELYQAFSVVFTILAAIWAGKQLITKKKKDKE